MDEFPRPLLACAVRARPTPRLRSTTESFSMVLGYIGGLVPLFASGGAYVSITVSS